MIYLENSIIGIRSSIFILKNESKIIFKLIPMVHIGEKSFFDQVQAELEKSDKVIYESVKSEKWYFNAPTYKNVGRSMGLISQGDGLNFDKIKNKLIHGDISSTEWNGLIAKLSLKEKLLIVLINPILRILLLFNYFIDKYYKLKTIEDINYESSHTYYIWESEKRNKYIVNKIDTVYKSLNCNNQEYIISLLYGAKHCPYIFYHLNKYYNYSVKDAKRLNVYNKSY